QGITDLSRVPAGTELAVSRSMPMLRLAPRQRAALSETLREFANLAAAALVLGQAIGERPVSWPPVLAGALIWLGFVWFGLTLEGER
ncbi:MAG: hypothetical protein ABL986_23835, partial [Vicinamibacterales bacterium]